MQTNAPAERRGLSPREERLYLTLVNKGKWVVTTQDAIEIEDISQGDARNLLQDLHRKDALVPAGKGIYAVAPPASLHETGDPRIDPFQVLDQLMDALRVPYYAGYLTAAYLHGGAHQNPQNTEVATPEPRRPLRLGPTRIRFHQIPEERMTGTTRIHESDAYLTASDIEKTLVDCAGRLDLCGGTDGFAQIIWELAAKADASKLRGYAEQDGRKPVIQRLGYILAELTYKGPSRVPSELHRALDPLRGERTYPLDPTRGDGGDVDEHWKISVKDEISVHTHD